MLRFIWNLFRNAVLELFAPSFQVGDAVRHVNENRWAYEYVCSRGPGRIVSVEIDCQDEDRYLVQWQDRAQQEYCWADELELL